MGAAGTRVGVGGGHAGHHLGLLDQVQVVGSDDGAVGAEGLVFSQLVPGVFRRLAHLGLLRRHLRLLYTLP